MVITTTKIWFKQLYYGYGILCKNKGLMLIFHPFVTWSLQQTTSYRRYGMKDWLGGEFIFVIQSLSYYWRHWSICHAERQICWLQMCRYLYKQILICHLRQRWRIRRGRWCVCPPSIGMSWRKKKRALVTE